MRAGLQALLDLCVTTRSGERRTVLLACACNFLLLADYYVLRPVRDTMATQFSAAQLNGLFLGSFLIMLASAPLYSWLVGRIRLTRLLPGLFWFWFGNLLLFALVVGAAAGNRWVAASYFLWFSVVNLYLISVFWTLMVELFTDSQATRVFAFIAAGGSVGAILGPLFTRWRVVAIGLDGLLWWGAGGFLLVIGLVHLLVREKDRLIAQGLLTPRSTLDHALPGSPLAGLRALFESRYMRRQALFVLLMTWVATIGYFLQTRIIAGRIVAVTSRALAIADIDLAVNILTALVLILGLARFVRRFGVTATLVLNPLIMSASFVALGLSPSLLMVQILQVVRRVTQYAIARPSREMCFTVLDQEQRYKAKNVLDTTVYRFGDVTAALLQEGLTLAGSGLLASVALGVAVSALWGGSALGLGRHFERLRPRTSR